MNGMTIYYKELPSIEDYLDVNYQRETRDVISKHNLTRSQMFETKNIVAWPLSHFVYMCMKIVTPKGSKEQSC